MPGLFPYVISKAGLWGLTRQVANECLLEGVTCNMVAPGLGRHGQRAKDPGPLWPARFPRGDPQPRPRRKTSAPWSSSWPRRPGRKINGEILYVDSGLHVADDAGMVHLPERDPAPLRAATSTNPDRFHSQAPDRTTRPGSFRMSDFVYCLNTSTIRPTPLLEKIRVAGRAGYQAIEPWNDEIDEYLEQGGTIAELKKALADAGLKVVSVIALHSWVTTEGDEYAKVLDECRRRMDQAVAAWQPLHRRQPPAGSRRPGPRDQTGSAN